jgi:hypothetical protein
MRVSWSSSANGSGKSNIADGALVSATIGKAVRARKPEVIFARLGLTHPLGISEASLVLDNSDAVAVNAPVRVTRHDMPLGRQRRIPPERRQVRLRDIAAPAARGLAPTATVIGRGSIDELILQRPRNAASPSKAPPTFVATSCD